MHEESKDYLHSLRFLQLIYSIGVFLWLNSREDVSFIVMASRVMLFRLEIRLKIA